MLHEMLLESIEPMDGLNSSGNGNAFRDLIGVSRPYPLFDGDPYFEDCRDLFGSPDVDYLTYRLHIDKYRQLPDPRPFGAVTSCPSLDYYPHLAHGGTVVKEPLPIAPPCYPNDGSYTENQGPTTVAILLAEGVVFAVNHHSLGPDICGHIGLIGPCMVAIISGGEFGECRRLLLDLLQKCGGETSVEELLKLMARILSSRLEVGLIAGWNRATDHPFLYRVDGSGGQIKSDILATGSQFRRLYAFLDLDGMRNSKMFSNQCFWDGVVENDSQYEKYGKWSNWAVHEAEKMALKGICDVAASEIPGEVKGGDLASVFFVGRNGMRKSYWNKRVNDVSKEML